MTWTYNQTTGRWESNWDGTTYKPGTLPHQAPPPRAAAALEPIDIGDKEAAAVWRAILRLTWEALGQGYRVTWPNIASWTAYTSKRTTYRNPRTGATGTTPAHPALRVRIAKALKKFIA